jgi:hypothetical protein
VFSATRQSLPLRHDLQAAEITAQTAALPA